MDLDTVVLWYLHLACSLLKLSHLLAGQWGQETKFPSFEFVVGDKNAKGNERLEGAKGIFGSPFVVAVGEVRNPTKARNPATGRLSLPYLRGGTGVRGCCRVVRGDEELESTGALRLWFMNI